MKKIGVFLDSEPYSGGMFQYNQSIISALSYLPKEEYQILVLYTKRPWENYLLKFDFEAEYIEINSFAKYLSKVGKILLLRKWRKISHYFHPLLKRIYNSGCDVWVFPSQDSFSYQVEVKTIAAIHDLMHRYQNFPEINKGGEFARRERLFSNIAKYASIMLVDSVYGKNQIAECYERTDESKIHVLPYVAPPYISDKETQDFDSKYNLPSKFLFYPAQFWEHKNHIRLFYALAEVRKVYPDIRLVLVGSKKNAYEKAFAVVKSLTLEENIIHLGYVEDHYIPMLYKRARALVMPTFFGPTNIPPLEAMALRCPVAISGIYGMQEQSKDAALYFDPNSVKEIMETIKLLWENDLLCTQLAEKGYLRFQNWNQAHFNQRFNTILETFLKQSGV